MKFDIDGNSSKVSYYAFSRRFTTLNRFVKDLLFVEMNHIDLLESECVSLQSRADELNLQVLAARTTQEKNRIMRQLRDVLDELKRKTIQNIENMRQASRNLEAAFRSMEESRSED
jgi:hypothetical protein